MNVASRLDLLSAWIEGQMAYAGLPALSIAIVHDQRLVWSRGFGTATPDTLFRIASITKLFTATAIMRLRDAGRLRLDDPVTEHLPWFPVTTVTIRHLITHTSGLSREAAFPYWTDGNFPTWDAIRSQLGEHCQVLPSDMQWKYSNLALALAGEVVGAASGEPYADYVRRHILEPLGMHATRVSSPAPDDPKLVPGFARRMPDGTRARAPWTDAKAITAAAGMTTSVTDLARFAMFEFSDGPAGGAQVLGGATLREMQRVHWLEPGWQKGWGLGFFIQRVRGKTYVGHGGSLRGYRTELRIRPADKIAVIVFTNADDGDPPKYVEKAFEWVAPAILEAAPSPPPRVADPAWARYVGRYRSAWGDAEVVVVDADLMLIGPAVPDPMETASRLVPAGEHTFRVETDHGYGIAGERVVFELDASGRVVRLRTGDNYAEPVERW